MSLVHLELRVQNASKRNKQNILLLPNNERTDVESDLEQRDEMQEKTKNTSSVAAEYRISTYSLKNAGKRYFTVHWYDAGDIREEFEETNDGKMVLWPSIQLEAKFR